MCGIAVAVDWPEAQTAVRTILDGVVHRGVVSDAIAYPWRETALATRRLPIVDPDGGTQPKLSADGRVLVAMNGEIYNHLELRRELEALGVSFQTGSDTEVLANAISQWGAAALRRLIGIYAFVALDLWKRDFLAARDPMGVKPLYVIQAGEAFLFSSEIAPLLNAAPVGEAMILPPGRVLTKAGCFLLRPAPQKDPQREIDLSPQALDRLLSEAVSRRLPTDVPFAILYSGGVDSTLVAHYAKRAGRTAPLYFLNGPNAPDRPFAELYASSAGLDLKIVDLVAEPTEARVRKTVAMCESYEPDVVRNAYCNAALAEQVRADGIPVALCGEGADELFAGYPTLEAGFAASDAIGAELRRQHLETMHRSSLQRIDRAGMAWQVEIREPFLDPAVIEYACATGRDGLLSFSAGDVKGKKPLRSVFDLYPEELPVAIRDRRKIPIAQGAGMEADVQSSSWSDFAEERITDREFADGKRRFARFDIETKEELYYLERLAEAIDVARVPHLTDRNRLIAPHFPGVSALSAYVRPDRLAS